MKKIILLLYVLISAFTVSAQTYSPHSYKNDSISVYIAKVLEDIDMRILKMNNDNRYKFYPTDNVYNFLKLDTRTGKIEQVQWSLDTSNEGSVVINDEDLSWYSGSSFELYPTKNIYQFLLLDKSNGRTWHVQWGLEDKKRWIRRIY